MASSVEATDIAVIGAGSIGIAVAYYLVTKHGAKNVVLLDHRDPMAMTSAQSGENYRNWWPHPVMTAFTNHATDLLEEIARHTGNRINMTRRGYALVTRRESPDDLISELYRGYADTANDGIRFHRPGSSATYQPALSADWETAPTGVDVLMNSSLIRQHFPSLASDAATVLHIRRAGDISGQQLGQFMLEAIRSAGGRLLRQEVVSIEPGPPFTLTLEDKKGRSTLRADRIVKAAGPFFGEIAAMLGEDLPVSCVFQQKIAFEDTEGAIPRTLPFTIDLDEQTLDWTEEERELLAADPEAATFLRMMPSGVHRRPDGGDNGRWIKLGWAYNTAFSNPHDDAPIDPHFPDIVIRGASRLNPALKSYLGRLPRGAHHYGGYYSMTPENWPLIGPMRTAGAFMAGALSGFGTMAATATGAVCAAWVIDEAQPSFASHLSLDRYNDPVTIAELREAASKGVL